MGVSEEEKKVWWLRSLDQYFRVLEGKQHRCRDPVELRQEISDGAERMVKDREMFAEGFQQDVDAYSQRFAHSLSGEAPLWRPLPSWQSWKRREKERALSRARFHEDSVIVNGRLVRGGLVPGGGRVHRTMEERERRGDSVYIIIGERNKRSKSVFMTMEEKLRARSGNEGFQRRAESGISREQSTRRWLPRERSTRHRENVMQTASGDAILNRWGAVEIRLGKVKGGRMYD